MKQFAVFDIDGTLIRWQLYHVVVDRLAKNNYLQPDAAARLQEARMTWKRREHIDAFTDYEQILVSIYEESLHHLDPLQFDKLVDGIVDEYKQQVYRYTRDLIKTLKQNGYVLLAISGSHHELVAEIAKFYGFDDWVGSSYERSEGFYTGEKFIASHHKKHVLQKLIDKHDLTVNDSYAVGDSKSDAEMLAMVQHPIAFNPDKKLYEIAQNNGWDIVLERKNVIYRLQSKDGSYVLAETDA